MNFNPRWAVLYGRMVGAAQQGHVRELVRLWEEVSHTLFVQCMVVHRITTVGIGP